MDCMMEKKYRVLSIGAHPDDADTSAGGLLLKLRDKGWDVRLLSVTDGSAGMYDISRCGAPLAEIRRKEAAASGTLLGGTYDVWDLPDARLTVNLENRERMIRYIREYRPDVIITNRPGDYHPDHRAAATLVADASYLLMVPYICSDVPPLDYEPVILYWSDGFQTPYPSKADVVVPIDGYEEQKVQLACCHECQYFDWMYWPDRMEKRELPREQQIEELRQRFLRGDHRDRDRVEKELIERFGAEKAAEIKSAEYYEICEFGGSLSEELKDILER